MIFFQVNDIRPGEHPKDEKLKNNFIKKHGENYLEKVSKLILLRTLLWYKNITAGKM